MFQWTILMQTLNGQMIENVLDLLADDIQERHPSKTWHHP